MSESHANIITCKDNEKALMKIINRKLNECYDDFHTLLDQMVDITKRKFLDSSNNEIPLEYYNKELEIAEFLKEKPLILCRSRGGVNSYQRLIRHRAKMPSLNFSEEVLAKERELMTIIDEIVETHGPLYDETRRSETKDYPFQLPMTTYFPVQFYTCMRELFQQVTHKANVEDRVQRLYNLSGFLLDFREELIYLKDLGVDMSPFYHISKLQNNCRVILNKTISQPDDNEIKQSLQKFIDRADEFDEVFSHLLTS